MPLEHYEDVYQKAPALLNAQAQQVGMTTLFYVFNGRNAWHSTWSQLHYGARSFCLTFMDAKCLAERHRVQGTTWYMEELPALVVCGSAGTLVLTEINTDHPLFSYRDAVVDGTTLREVADTLKPRKPNSVARFLLNGDEVPTYRSKRLRFKSVVEGGAWPLYWKEVGRSKYNAYSLHAIKRRIGASLKTPALAPAINP